MILNGELGEIQAIRSNYIQGWLRTRLESEDQKQASWRTDPSKSGAAGCFGDIGTHAYNLARYMTGLMPAEVSFSLDTDEILDSLTGAGITVETTDTLAFMPPETLTLRAADTTVLVSCW